MRLSRHRPLSLAASIVMLAAWFFLARPAFMGGSTSYILVSGHSMEPNLYTGDLAVLRRQAEYRVGDVIAYQVEGGVVIHRIIGGDAKQGYFTQGDNRDTKDGWKPTPNTIGGKMVFHVPKVGIGIGMMKQPQNLPVVAGLMGVFMVLGGGRKKLGRRPKPRPVMAHDSRYRLSDRQSERFAKELEKMRNAKRPAVSPGAHARVNDQYAVGRRVWREWCL